MNKRTVILLIVFFCGVCRAAEIDTSGFNESRESWYEYNGSENLIKPEPNQRCYKPTQIKEIADNILLYQKNNGGWPENYDMLAILTKEQKEKLTRAKNSTDTTFDNGTTYMQIEYLAKVYQITKDEKYKDAALKGIDFTLSAQYANGGWPQVFPLEKNYYSKFSFFRDFGFIGCSQTVIKNYTRYITFNDDAMTGVMEMLKDITDNKSCYDFVDAKRREKIKTAFDKGLDCILKCQIVDNGKLTAWCQQHDEKNLKPTGGRAYELPSICNEESTNIVLFLMSIDKPDEKIINSIESAVKWFEESKITGIRVDEIKAPEVKYKYGISKRDRVVVEDANAEPIWARFYELGTHRPLFADRRGIPLYSLAEVNRERRSDYEFYTHRPQKALKKYPEWKKKNGI